MKVIVLLTLFLISNENSVFGQSAAQIKAQITRDNAWQFIGIGGRYGYLKTIVSKRNLIESDHFPPKSIYSSAASLQIRRLSQDNMAAVSLQHSHHRGLITTNNPRRLSAQANLIGQLRRHFQAGNYARAIDLNISWYRSNPDTNGNARSRFDQYIKEGIMNALAIHVKNGLLTNAQAQALVQKHALNVRNPVLTTLVNLPLRDRAIQLVRDDTVRYNARG